MITAARVALSANRWTPFAYVIAFRGVDLTAAGLHAQVRLSPDTPGDPLIDLAPTNEATALGLRLMSVDTSGAIPISYVRLQIPGASLGDEVPAASEVGSDLTLAWDLLVTPAGRTESRWLYGDFVVRAGVTQLASAALANDPAPGAPDAIVTLDGEALAVTIGGADMLAALIDDASAALDGKVEAAETAEAGATTALGEMRHLLDPALRRLLPDDPAGYAFSVLPVGTGWRWGLAGSDGSFFGLLRADNVFAPERIALPDGTVSTAQLTPDVVAGLLPTITSFSALPAGMGLRGAAVGADGSLLYTIDGAGLFDMRVTRAQIADSAGSALYATRQGSMSGQSFTVFAKADGSIWAQKIGDGSTIQAIAAGSNGNPRLDSGGKRVIYTSATGDRVAPLDRDIGRGLSYPAVPSATVTGIGDSYTDPNTAGTVSYMTHLAALEPSWTLVNRGYGGDRCDHIAFRVGASQAFVTLAGNQIPADTSAVAATITGAPIRATDLTISVRAPTGDVQGNLHFDGTNYTYARAVAGAVVAVPAGTEIVSAYADATRSTIRIISGSVNDQAAGRTTDQIIADIIAIMDDQRTIAKATIVMGCWDSRWFSAQQIANKTVINAALAAACAQRGMCFLDTCSYVIANALDIMAANSITPTATDTADLARGIIPYSLRADPALDATGTHVSTIVTEIWAEQVRDLILAKGYIS